MPRLKKLKLFSNFSGHFSVPSLKHKTILNFATMKKFGITILLAAIIMSGYFQEVSAKIQNDEKNDTLINRDKNTGVSIGKDMVGVEKEDSSLNTKVGNRRLSILESLEEPGDSFKKYVHNNNRDQKDYENDHSKRKVYWSGINIGEDNEDNHHRKRNKFHGHWTGIELGYNNFLSSDKSFSMPSDIDYMTLHSGKSSCFNINFTQLSLGLTRHFGFVTGLGLNWNNYRFDGNNNIQKGAGGIIEELDPGLNLEKSKLATLFLTLPFMLELQIPANNNHLHIAAGPIGAVKLGSHTKMVFENGHTIKSYGDFSLNMLRYGATARVGYGNFQLYGTYYVTPLFQTGKGPAGNDLYPFEIGVAFTFND
jgi:hypothetical protein